jgi:hypothetical protein
MWHAGRMGLSAAATSQGLAHALRIGRDFRSFACSLPGKGLQLNNEWCRNFFFHPRNTAVGA